MDNSSRFIEPNFSVIPDELKNCDQWVCWKGEYDPENGKWSKIPIDAKTGRYASINNRDSWSDFETVVSRYKQKKEYDGIGFVLTEDDPFTGWDLDKCINEKGRIHPKAQGMIDTLNSYTEISPSGKGIRIFVRSDLPTNGRKKGKVEVYHNGRYLTVTGKHVDGSPLSIETRKKETNQIHSKMSKTKPTMKSLQVKNENSDSNSDSDNAILKSAFQSKAGKKIKKLYDGDWSDYSSQSEADLALSNQLAFWFGKDRERMDRVFRLSGLYRSKWDEIHNASGLTYGEMTIAKAIENTHKTYQGGKKNSYEEEDEDNIIGELNEKHAGVMIGGKFRIMNFITDYARNQPDISFSTVADFKNFYSNQTVEVSSGENKKRISKAELWLKSEDRMTYKDIIFNPNGNKDGCYNLFQGLSIEAQKGKWDLFRKHIFEVIANGNQEIYDYLISWLADLFQNLGGERPGVAIVLRGGQGTGKGTFVNLLGKILGKHFMPISSQRYITGRFNGHMKDALLVFWDEAIWAGDRSAEGQLKHLITEPYILIEHKGKDSIVLDNHTRHIIASNSDWVVPAGRGERRFFTLDINELRKDDHQYFEKIYKQMENGGYEAMLYDLLEFNLKNVNLRIFPKTEALLEQKLNTMSPVEKYWYERLVDGSILSDDESWKESHEIKNIYDDLKLFCERINTKYYNGTSQFSKELRKLCPNIKNKRANHQGNRRRVLCFPSLEQCRKEFEECVGSEISWET